VRHRFIQDPQTGELVPAAEYRREQYRGVMIAPDLPAFEVPGEPGNWIEGRKARRELMAARNWQEVGNEAPAWLKERMYADRHR
jgi:hypothetical protein